MSFTSKPASIPEFATTDVVDPTTGENNVVEPSAGKKLTGWNYLEKPARNYFNWLHRFNYLWIDYFNQFFSSSHQFKIDEIIENSGGYGVSVTGLKANTIAEKTSTAGVTIDSHLIKDGESWGCVPVGSIVAWLPGYFTNSSNGSYSAVSITLPSYYKECDGSALNDSASPIFNGAGRYLPNLTDSRFLMGNTSGNAGTTGGSNDLLAHTHAFTQPSAHSITQPTFTGPSHNHEWYYHNGSSGNDKVWASTGIDRELNLSYPKSGTGLYIPLNVSSSGNYSVGNSYTENEGTENCTRTTDVALSAHSGGAVGAVSESRTGANIPIYLSVRYIMRTK